MANGAIRSYNGERARIFGKKPTGTQRMISWRSKVWWHSEFVFSGRYGGVSSSATMEDDCKCCRFKFIECSHPERWDSIIVPMTDEQEDMAWAEACDMAGLPTNWNSLYGGIPWPHQKGSYFGPKAIPYDLRGQLCHATKLNIIKPNPRKIWCSKAVARPIYKPRPDFLEFMAKFKLVDELRPDQLHIMAQCYFTKDN